MPSIFIDHLQARLIAAYMNICLLSRKNHYGVM